MGAGWATARMGDIAPLVRRPVETHADQMYREIGIRSFGKGVFHKAPTSGLEIGSKRVFAVEPGDLLFNIVFAWEGAVAVATEAERGMIGSHRFLTCVTDKRRADARYLNYWFRRSEGRDQLLWASPGGAGRNRTLGIDKLSALEVPLPPLDEQRRIVVRIDALAAKIAEARGLRQQTTALANAASTKLGDVHLDALTAAGHLGDVLRHPPRNGWSPVCDNADHGVPVLTLSAVTGWHFRPNAIKRTSLPTRSDAHYWLQPGDLLMTRSNTPDLVGHVAVYDGCPSPCIYPDLVMKLAVDGDRALPKFIWYWMQSPRARNHIRREAKGTSPTMKKISQGAVVSTPFPTGLALVEQRRIVTELDALQAKVDAVKLLQTETAIELDALLPAILDRAFKGEL